MSGGFQQQVYNSPRPAVAGDFASQNPYFTYNAGPGGLVAGDSLHVGRFAWVTPPLDPNGTGKVANSYGSGPVAGFVHREMQATIVDYLAIASMKLLPGQQCTLMTGGDFWVVNDGATIATIGMKAFAKLADGKVRFAATGTIVGGASATGSDIAADSNAFTGSINGDVLTVTASPDPTYPGMTLSGTGIVGSPKIVRQLTGSANGIGTYLIDVLQSADVASTTITGSFGVLTVGTATGTFEVGDILTGTNVVSGTRISQFISGSGGSASTAVVQFNTVVSSTTITASDAVETPWYAESSGIAGEIVKISRIPAPGQTV